MVAAKGMKSNLDSFLRSTTPIVPSRILAKSEMRKLNSLWHPWQKENVEFFTLEDLWNCFDEWSFYGVGVPISRITKAKRSSYGSCKLETLMHYYVPHLSALQIFTSNPSHSFRVDTDSGDGETTNSSDESESGKVSSRWDGSSEESGSVHDIPLVNDNRLGYLYCEYFEESTPYVRAPLKDKITSLAQRYPGLMSLKSVDLSPASWMAVSWYPVYPIPMGRASKDLSTCFLTYHTLSSSFQDMNIDEELDGSSIHTKRKHQMEISLEPFGVVSHKMEGSLWESGREGRDKQRLASFFGAADSWLKQLRVQHPDFNYFTLRRG